MFRDALTLFWRATLDTDTSLAGSDRVTPTAVACNACVACASIVTLGSTTDREAKTLRGSVALATLTVRSGGGVVDTSTPVVEKDWLVEADTVTVGRSAVSLLAALVCKLPFVTLTEREGGGAVDTSTPVVVKP
jgi:hypothetical protein